MATHELRITVRDGRYLPFPPPNHTGVAVRAVFGSKMMRTRAVKDIAHAEWKEDLVFPLGGAELRRLKSMRAPIKVEVWTPSDRDPDQGVVLGHVLLDIRTAEQHYIQRNNMTPMAKPNGPTVRSGGKWYALSRSADRQPPELRLHHVLSPLLSRHPRSTSPSTLALVQSRSQPVPQRGDDGEDLDMGMSRSVRMGADVDLDDVGDSPVFKRVSDGPRPGPVRRVPLESKEILQIGEGLTSFSLLISFHGAFNLTDLAGMAGPGLRLQLEAEVLGARARTAIFNPDPGEGEESGDIGDIVTAVGPNSLVFKGDFGATIPILSSDSELAALWASAPHRPSIMLSVIASVSESESESPAMANLEEEGGWGRAGAGEEVLATAVVDTTRLTLRTPVRFRAGLKSAINTDENDGESDGEGDRDRVASTITIDGQVSLSCAIQKGDSGVGGTTTTSGTDAKRKGMGMSGGVPAPTMSGTGCSGVEGPGRLGYGYGIGASNAVGPMPVPKFGSQHAGAGAGAGVDSSGPIHHWRFGIDLHGVRDIKLAPEDAPASKPKPRHHHHLAESESESESDSRYADGDEDYIDDHAESLCVYLRYAYPLFGSPVPISTDPPVVVDINSDADEDETETEGGDTLLPSSFCMFEFAASLSELASGLASEPLNVAAMHRGAPPVGEACFARSEVWLSRVLEAPDVLDGEKDNDRDRKKPRSLQTLDTYIPLFAIPGALAGADSDDDSEGDDEKERQRSDYACGYIRVILSLEDMGVLRIPESQTELDAHRREMEALRAGREWSGAVAAPSGVSASEYAAAWELEMWKKSETMRFQKQLEAKERQYMDAIAEEWKRREHARQQESERRLHMLAKLEEKARTTLADVERRDKAAREAQHLLARAQAVLKEEQDKVKQNAKDEIRRVKEEATHKAELAKARQAESERVIKGLRGRAADLERRYQELEEALAKQRRAQLTQNPNATGIGGRGAGGKKDREKEKNAEEEEKDKDKVALRQRVEELTGQLADVRVALAEAETRLGHSEAARDRALKELGDAVSAVRVLRRQKKALESARFEEERAEVEAERAALEDARAQAATQHEAQQLNEIKAALSRLKMQEARLAVATGFEGGDGDEDDGADQGHRQRQRQMELPLTRPEVHRRIHFPHSELNSGSKPQTEAEAENQIESGSGMASAAADVEVEPLSDANMQRLINGASASRVAEWRRERDALLSTGVYGTGDPIVKRLTVLIQAAEAGK